MAFIPGGGIRFAVPDVHNIKTDNYSNAAGGIAYGPNGEKYQVYFNFEATSRAAGLNAWHNQAVTNATNSAMGGFVAAASGSAAPGIHWLGAYAQSVTASALVWVQVAGTITRSLTAADSASASVVGHGYVGSDTGQLAVSTGATAITGNYGIVWAAASAGSSTVTLNLAGRGLVG